MLRVLSRGTRFGRCGTIARRRTAGAGYTAGDIGYGLPLAGSFNLHRRTFGGIPPVLLPPVVFGGLLVVLWTWKSLMLVVFQNKIIYMPGLPPNARREKIEDYKNQCGGIKWREERIIAADGTRISLCVTSVNCAPETTLPVRNVYVLYFQGNASSIPPRLPFLSQVQCLLRDRATILPVRYTMVCCSYRGFWTSKGRPSERGIAIDAVAALRWIRDAHASGIENSPPENTPVVIWGQSIGAGVATTLSSQAHIFSEHNICLKALILETPFLSIRAMLETLYPEQWLPYRYLWPFLRNHFDNWTGLGVMQKSFRGIDCKPPIVTILQAGNDELVPKEHGDALQRRCNEVGLSVTKKMISNALHTEIMMRPHGRLAVVESIESAIAA